MDLTDTAGLATLLGGLLIAIGILGVIIPVLPGLLLCWLGVLVWAVLSDVGAGRWFVLAIVTVVAATGTAVKYLWPGRNMKRSGVPTRTLVIGGLFAIVGFFVIPLLGLVIGFILGVYVAERIRLGDSTQAWPSTKSALMAAGLAMIIEILAAMTIAGTWLVGLATT